MSHKKDKITFTRHIPADVTYKTVSVTDPHGVKHVYHVPDFANARSKPFRKLRK